VIKTNTGAYELYKKAGFTVIREFDYFISEKDKIKLNPNKLNKGFQIKELDNPDWDKLKTFWEFNPSWQNSIDSITRKIAYFKILGVFNNNTLAGYGIIEKHTGDIPQIAIAKQHCKNGLGTKLFYNLIKNTTSNEIKLINSDADYSPFKIFIERLGLKPGQGQYEMMLKL
jgi:ribosomal protein S18 acetylase RimI-like enzyme